MIIITSSISIIVIGLCVYYAKNGFLFWFGTTLLVGGNIGLWSILAEQSELNMQTVVHLTVLICFGLVSDVASFVLNRREKQL